MTHRAFLVTLAAVIMACKGASSGAPDASAPPPKGDAAPPLPLASATSAGAESRSANAPAGAVARTFAFDTDATDKPPANFAFGRTGSGAQGRWIVRTEPGSPSGANVLAQVDADDTNFRFPIAVATEPKLANVRVSVRCKMISGRVDQACGLVARYADENNYLLTRANSLENNIRLYTVKDGRRSEVASFSGAVTHAVWHEYRFELRGDHLQVFWDGKQVLDHRDSTFAAAGLAGVWTKADSITYFDDLTIEPL
jgi:hypothetical protein